MSFILLLDNDKLESLLTYLPKYELLIESAEPIFNLEGRRLEEVARTLPHFQQKYERAYNELKGLDAWVESIKEKRMAKLWKKYNEGYARQLSTKDIQMYIGGEKEIIEINQIGIEVTLLKQNLFAIVEAIKNMGWMVGHITKIRVAELQETIL